MKEDQSFCSVIVPPHHHRTGLQRVSLHPRLCFFFHFLRFWPRSQTQNLLLLFCRHRSISFGSRGIIISQMSKKTFVQHKCHLLLTRNEIFWDIRIIVNKLRAWLFYFQTSDFFKQLTLYFQTSDIFKHLTLSFSKLRDFQTSDIHIFKPQIFWNIWHFHFPTSDIFRHMTFSF